MSTGFLAIFAKARRSNRPRLPASRLQCSVTMSERASRSSRLTGSAPWLRTSAVSTRGSAGEDGEPEAARAPADGLANASETDDPEREAGEPADAAHFVPAPVLRSLHLAVVVAQAALARQHQRERMVRDLVRAVFADGGDPDAAFRRRLGVHAVPARRRHRDDPAASQPAEHLAVEGHVVREDRVRVAAGGGERVGIAAVGEGRDARVGGQVPTLDRQVAALGFGHLGEDDRVAQAELLRVAALTASVRADSSTADIASPGHSGSMANMPPTPASAASRQPITVASEAADAPERGARRHALRVQRSDVGRNRPAD